MLLWTWRCRYLFELVFLFPLDILPEVEFLDHRVVLFLIFWGSSILFSIVAVWVYNPTDSAQGFPFFHIHSNHFFSLTFLMMAILTGVRWYLIVLIYISLMNNDFFEHTFMYMLAFCMSSLEKWLFRSFAHIVIALFVFFLLLSYMRSLYILDINPLSGIWCANIFTHFVSCLFTLLMVSFAVQKLFGLM